jgi:putative phosphoesterase
MTVKIGLISDVHATPDPLREALNIFTDQGIETILCAGDIAGYGPDLEQSVQLLIDYRCETIIGNHDLWHFNQLDPENEKPFDRYLRSLPRTLEFSVEGKNMYMVHASPPVSILDGIKLLDENANIIPERIDLWSDSLNDFPYDLLIVGHTHQVFSQRLGDVLIINPGSTVFNHTCVILTLPEMEVETIPLSGKKPLLSWNWGMQPEVINMRNAAK